MTTPETVEQRLTALEHQVARLSAEVLRLSPPRASSDESRGERLIREAEQSRPATIAASERVMKQLGIQGEPIGAKKLRELLIADGWDPNDNSFSRELIAMREE
jgi:hypothetical protein